MKPPSVYTAIHHERERFHEIIDGELVRKAAPSMRHGTVQVELSGEIAGAYGVDHRRIGMLTAGIGTAMGAVAGVLIGINQAVFPQLAFEWIGLIFAVVILGGIGNLLGAVAAGILIGFVTSIVGVAWTPQGAPLITFLLLILALIFRPNGLFGRLGTS